MKTPTPLNSVDILRIALEGGTFPVERVLATFADPANWAYLRAGEIHSGWAFVGPVTPPYELAQHALDGMNQKLS